MDNDFKDKIKALGRKVPDLKGKVQTEEATKMYFVVPFIQILGYDTTSPHEVIPEYTTKDGAQSIDRVDYALLKENEEDPIIIIECKHHAEDLKTPKHHTQMFKYFSLSKARFAVLTNGINYHFYSDLEKLNKLDPEPFLEFDITQIKDVYIEELKKFGRNNFDCEKMLDAASELKYSSAIKEIIVKDLKEPSQELVKYYLSKVYSGQKTEKVITKFTETVKKVLNQTINEIFIDKITATQEEKVGDVPPVVEEIKEDKIVTTPDELEAFYTVKSILRQKVEAHRVTYKDFQSYFNIILDNKNKKILCRIHFASKKRIGLFDSGDKETLIDIEEIDDIYKYSDQLLKTIDLYEKEAK